MDDVDGRLMPARPARLTARTRLTVTFAGLFTAAGAVLVLSTYAFMRYVPTYAITTSPRDGAMPVAASSAGATVPVDAVPSVLLVQDQSDILNTLLGVSLVLLVVLAALSAWVGWILAGRILRPLQAINFAAQRAATGSFDHRIALVGPRDEITNLSDTFDHMLDRLGNSFHSYQRFAANASHELRTPLATIQAMLDVASRDPACTSQSAELFDQLRQTNSRSIDTVNAILALADAENAPLRQEPVALGALAASVLEDASPDAGPNGITTSFEGCPGVIRGDAVMLQRMCENLIQNAIRYNVSGGYVTVRVGRTPGPRGGDLYLRVENSGCPIDRETLPRLVEPFYRGSGRVAQRGVSSHGLGLAIVKSIVDAHQASLQITGGPQGGLSVMVVFPQLPSTSLARIQAS